MLRIDVDGGTRLYAIPSTNPYAGATAGEDEIWAVGVRNPWKFSFDRQTGDLWIADVGQKCH
jgi:glucose/arabinose dehydrogenase